MTQKLVRIVDRAASPARITVGNKNDNKAEEIKFVLPAHLADAAVFLHINIGEYSDIVQLGNDRIYTPIRTHTAHPGWWEAWLEAQRAGDVVWHSNTFSLCVGDLPDAGAQIEQQYPTAIEEALRAVDTLTGVQARAETLPPDSEATVSFEEDAEGNRTIVYGIPRGKDGEGGNGGSAEIRVDGKTIVQEDGVLRVNTTDKAEADNTQPITSAGVYTIVGNINAILKSI